MGEVSRRQRPPWKPERGQYVRVGPLAIPEWAGFSIVVAFCVILLVVALVAF